MRIAFIGAGKVGITLGMYFQKKGLHIIGYYSRTYKSAKVALEKTDTKIYDSIDALLIEADIIFITTNDDQIVYVAEMIAQSKEIRKEHILIHTSGAHTSAIFSELNLVSCGLYSLHPLQSFVNPETTVNQLETTVFTLEGNGINMASVKGLLDQIGNSYFTIDQELKPLYHAGACVVSNYLVTLMNLGFDFFESAGIQREKIFDAISPLIYGTLENIKHKDMVHALTGPIVRGDEKTLKAHIESISRNRSKDLGFYQYLGLQTIDMIDGKRMSQETANRLKKSLRGEKNV